MLLFKYHSWLALRPEHLNFALFRLFLFHDERLDRWVVFFKQMAQYTNASFCLGAPQHNRSNKHVFYREKQNGRRSGISWV